MGARFLAWFCDQGWIQSTLFRRQVRLVKECLPLVGRSVDDQSDVIRESLACNLWRRWRLVALSRCTSKEFQRWVSITGLPILQESCRKGDGVVLVTSHLASLFALRPALHREGFDDRFGVGYRYSLFEIPKGLSLGSQLYEGKQVLKRGGIVMIVADGHMGSSRGIEFSLFGRRRVFRTGFAELALSTGAGIVPVSTSMDTTGHAVIRFMPPLEIPSLSHQQQTESLVSQYVEILHREWAENLGNVTWRHLKKFLQLQSVSEPTE
jgi:KDO2-lipid IV(A) lauroyltransferase